MGWGFLTTTTDAKRFAVGWEDFGVGAVFFPTPFPFPELVVGGVDVAVGVGDVFIGRARMMAGSSIVTSARRTSLAPKALRPPFLSTVNVTLATSGSGAVVVVGAPSRDASFAVRAIFFLSFLFSFCFILLSFFFSSFVLFFTCLLASLLARIFSRVRKIKSLYRRRLVSDIEQSEGRADAGSEGPERGVTGSGGGGRAAALGLEAAGLRPSGADVSIRSSVSLGPGTPPPPGGPSGGPAGGGGPWLG